MTQQIFKSQVSRKKICLWVFYINITHIKWFLKFKNKKWITESDGYHDCPMKKFKKQISESSLYQK